ncbi:MAG TPA: hypothetical protein PKD64_18225 [Pirellulaceae bacterium]|nr:hypothetical protein [Pirellulaceae bacterium]HMO94126.1 hypothetical protein [Pirellulaceae bacterium]HMP70841.1 hypothetical protein [Pirellulaceae bacterium]
MTQLQVYRIREVVERLADEEMRFNLRERRSSMRRPCIRPAKIRLSHGVDLDALLRNISENGLGMVHNTPIENCQKALVEIARIWDAPLLLTCRLSTCKKWSSGWYISGWKIISFEND